MKEAERAMQECPERAIERIVVEEMEALNRPDLFRRPLVAFSSAADARYAELKTLVGDWHAAPTDLLPDAQSVVSCFVPFTRKVVTEPRTVRDGSPLWGEAYVVINAHFERINASVSRYLAGLGYSASPIKPTHTYDPRDLKSMWSHRSAAAIAGLGSFGANRLLISSKGSGGRFCTLLTSAPLKASPSPAPNRCLYVKDGSCGLCFKICPVKALAPGAFQKFICQDELNKNDEKQRPVTGYRADTCGKCIGTCPVAYIE